jgi:alpha-D-ribose 1-methylphosphonate 5-triphosphate synthase subunit PhnL
MDLFLKYLQDNYSPDTGKLLIQRMGKTMDVIYNKDGYAVYKIIPSS